MEMYEEVRHSPEDTEVQRMSMCSLCVESTTPFDWIGRRHANEAMMPCRAHLALGGVRDAHHRVPFLV